MGNTVTTITVIACVSLVALVATRLAARDFDPRWRRRGWCVSVFAVVGAVLGGGLAAFLGKGPPGAELPPALFCAVLGARTGNIIRILSGPERNET